MVPMGQVDGVAPVKRRPGRPPKLQGVVVEAEPIAVAEAAVVGRRAGKPSKKNDGMVGGGAGGSVLGKRARKVKKTGVVSALVGNGDGGKRGRDDHLRCAASSSIFVCHMAARPDLSPATVAVGSGNMQVSAAGAKRKPGRPPKVQSNGGGSSSRGVTAPFDPIGAAPTMVHRVAPVKRRPGRPRKLQGMVVEVEAAVVGRRPGRPCKKNAGMVGGGTEASVLGKRVRKVKKTSTVSTLGGNGDGGKRGRGRPPKMRAVGLVMGQRPRGRPRAGTVSRPRGRPRKTMALTVSGGGGAALVPVEGMGGAGRPPKMAVRRKPRKLSGKPLGRPKKDASAPIQASNQQQMVSYQDLKARMENLQSRVKHAVDILKPYLNDEAAVKMLQGLEELALMDMCAPLQAGAETTAGAAPSSDPDGPQSGPVAPLSVQGSKPPNTNY